jgi:AmiR/NasT family two-component response regulator
MQVQESVCARCAQLEEALENRTVIAAAVGVLMERETLDPIEAFETLLVASRLTGRKLENVAQDLVSSASATALEAHSSEQGRHAAVFQDSV